MVASGTTLRESMPEFVQLVMHLAPTTHFVAAGQAILYRGAGLATVWPQFLLLTVIGVLLSLLALARFRRSLGALA